MKYLLLGAGLQGTAIAFDLLRQADDTTLLTVCDADPGALARLRARLPDDRLRIAAGDVGDPAFLTPLLADASTVISAVNYWFNLELTQLAIAHGRHFLDLGGNIHVVERQLALDGEARAAGITVVPDCGLAPGMATLLAYHLQTPFEAVESLRVRVGGLPQDPRPPLGYRLLFAVQGLINEYIEPAVVVRDGVRREVASLADVEELEFPPPFGRLEAFNTSGGISTLPLTLAGRVREMDYKTIRYPGHCERFRVLVDLGLCASEPVEFGGGRFAPRDFLGERLERALGYADRDWALVLIEVEGRLGGRRQRRSLRLIDAYDATNGISAMMRTTGYPAAIIARMLASGAIARRGVQPQELAVPGETMLAELRARGIRPDIFDTPLE